MRAFWDVLATAALAVSLLLGRSTPVLGQDDATCLMCHSSASMFEGREDVERLVVSGEELAGSTHAPLSCVDCHQDLIDSEFPHGPKSAPVDCGTCHSGVQRTYAGSVHGYAASRGNPRAPTCASCHGSHDILPSRDPRSPTHRVRLPATCAACHGAAGLLTDQIVKLPQPFAPYVQSVHGQGAARGAITAASCADCHGVHGLKGPADPSSRINRMNVAGTCGRCHPDVELEYERSIHGRALKIGVMDSPTCIDCHGEHLILSPADPDAKTYAARLAAETCGPCHSDPVIIAKYNLEGDVVGSYVDSYHGWATRRGGEEAATCVSCHTAHSVLPAEDPASTIHPANAAATCGRCHDNVDERFVASYSHESASIATNPIIVVIRRIYIWLIVVIIGAMVLHNLVIMNYYVIERRREEENSTRVLRLDRAQVLQHLLTTLSFILLVITGFALRFPEAWWVERLTAVGMTEGVRRDLHRIFAVVLIFTAIYHLLYIVLTRRGKEEIRSILPAWQDIKDLFRNIRYHTWRSRQQVEFGRYGYPQKVEYWALVWGGAVMVLTGLVLWFPQWSVKILPSWIVPVAQTIHYYEAWLATLAVLVWHFFFVIFHPEAYPMSWTWLTGRMSEKAVKRHHARWYKQIVAARAEDGASAREAGGVGPDRPSSDREPGRGRLEVS
jgi:formate dehydrogenase gamma subunit